MYVMEKRDPKNNTKQQSITHALNWQKCIKLKHGFYERAIKGQNREVKKGVTIKPYSEESYGMLQNKQIWQDIGRHHEERKDLARNWKERLMGRKNWKLFLQPVQK